MLYRCGEPVQLLICPKEYEKHHRQQDINYSYIYFKSQSKQKIASTVVLKLVVHFFILAALLVIYHNDTTAAFFL